VNLGLHGRVALVTGSSDGMGEAIAHAFAAEGAALGLCARNEEKLRKTAAKIKSRYDVPLEIRPVDVSRPHEVEQFIEEMLAKFQHIDICVANAGGPPAKAFLETTDNEWQAAFEANLHSAVVLARQVLPAMKRRNWGRFITISSLSVRQPLPNLALSNTVRIGLLGLIRTISNEFAAHGITANNVAPGYTATGRLKELSSRLAESSGKTPEEIERDWVAGIPAGRLAQSEEVADAVLWLASERAAMITGQTLLVDGGMYRGV
jgi:3-oxoacyl-[acyl-carrier protein] reductase